MLGVLASVTVGLVVEGTRALGEAETQKAIANAVARGAILVAQEIAAEVFKPEPEAPPA